MDELTLVLILSLVSVVLVPLAVLAHAWIAYRLAPRRIEAALDGPLGDHLLAKVTERVGPGISAWISSPEGETLVGRLGDVAIRSIQKRLADVGKAQLARATRSAGTDAARLLEAIHTGNPLVDGALGMIPREWKAKIGRQILGMMKSSIPGLPAGGEAAMPEVSEEEGVMIQ